MTGNVRKNLYTNILIPLLKKDEISPNFKRLLNNLWKKM